MATGTLDAHPVVSNRVVSIMSNVIPFDRAARATAIPTCPIDAVDDDELDIRHWELIMSGQRGSPVYLGIEREILKRKTQSSAA